MKRTIIVCTALSLALAAGGLVGCGGQSASSEGSEEASAATTQTQEEQSTEELVAEFKQALASIPAYQSATATIEETATVSSDEESSSGDETPLTTVCKFDASSGTPRSSAEVQLGESLVQYYTEGDSAVLVDDGVAYAGTTEQFDLSYTGLLEDYLAGRIGDLNAIADCAATAQKTEEGGLTLYALDLDPELYIQSDEALQALADAGMAVTEASFVVGFGDDGRIATIDQNVQYTNSSIVVNITISDYDNTTVEALPEATKTFEDYEAYLDASIPEVAEEDDSAEEN